ncbi:MAG: Chorismate binding-like protein [Candidatus Dadabacteria bacterium]|nr:Chorismate binding-like protein [Candidatus Dadabacteria bacterium]
MDQVYFRITKLPMSLESNSPCSALFLDSGGGWLPDMVRPGSPQEESSFVFFRDPVFSLSSLGQGVSVSLQDRKLNFNRDPLSVLEGYLSEGCIAVGYVSYEYSRFTEDGFTPIWNKEGETLPDMYFLFFKESDVTSGSLEDLKNILPTHYQTLKVYNPLMRIEMYSNMTKMEYLNMIRFAKEYIASGDIYQVNLSQRFTTPILSPPIFCFLNLFVVQPVPYGCYIDFGQFQLISGSMELFLRKTGRKIVTKPIKGTRKKGFSVEEDAILKAELISSQKERAENLMIVDLMRNDLGRVCNYGTVKVNNLFNIESYATLHQMVSEVEGYLKDEIRIGDIIKSTFPPGSVTGAPKRRAVELIDELEPHVRGPYCGAIGIFYPNGDFTLSVGIRIMLVKKCIGTFWVGGGIVWDSDPEKEFDETLVKARAIQKALGIVE